MLDSYNRDFSGIVVVGKNLIRAVSLRVSCSSVETITRQDPGVPLRQALCEACDLERMAVAGQLSRPSRGRHGGILVDAVILVNACTLSRCVVHAAETNACQQILAASAGWPGKVREYQLCAAAAATAWLSETKTTAARSGRDGRMSHKEQ